MAALMPSPIEEAMGHLGAALIQVQPSDDAIVVQHMRDAHRIASEEWRRQRDERKADL